MARVKYFGSILFLKMDSLTFNGVHFSMIVDSADPELLHKIWLPLFYVKWATSMNNMPV